MAQFKDMEVFIKRYEHVAESVVDYFAGTGSGIVGFILPLLSYQFRVA